MEALGSLTSLARVSLPRFFLNFVLQRGLDLADQSPPSSRGGTRRFRFPQHNTKFSDRFFVFALLFLCLVL